MTYDLAEILEPEQCALYWCSDTDEGLHVTNVRDSSKLPERATLGQLRKQFGKSNVTQL